MKHSPQQIAFNEVVRQSIMADPAWREGNYYEYGQPEKGLSVARMIGHITFMSDQSMEEKFSRRLKNGQFSFGFDADFEVEGYLHYRGAIIESLGSKPRRRAGAAGRLFYTEFDLDNLMRMDTATRYDTKSKAITGGWMSPNEARAAENMQPVPGGESPYLAAAELFARRARQARRQGRVRSPGAAPPKLKTCLSPAPGAPRVPVPAPPPTNDGKKAVEVMAEPRRVFQRGAEKLNNLP